MSGIFLKILHMGYAAGWLMTAVILARLLLKKAPKRMICLLWALAALRLLCPFSVKSALSLIPDSETLMETAVHEISFPAETDLQNIYPYVMDNGDHVEIGENVLHNGDHAEIGENVLYNIPEQSEYDVMDTLAAGWAAGVVLMLAYGIHGYYRIKRRTGASIPVRENIMKCDVVDTPFILGVLRPRIFLPSVMEDSVMEYVVAHERAHIKRRDHWWKPMGFLILCVYWFHPLCWISYILFCRDLELACDESVVKTMNMDNKKAYANALLSYSMNRSRIAAYPLAFGEVGVKERIRSILNYKKPAFWMIAVSAAIGIAVAVCFLTDPERKNEEEQPGVSSQITESSKDGFAEDSFSEGYTDEELCRMAYAYCIVHSEREDVPVHVEVDHVLEDGKVLIHLYDVVYDGDGIGWTSSWDWYTVDRITGKGLNFYDEEIDLTEVLENESVVNGGETLGQIIIGWAQAVATGDRETIELLAPSEIKDGELDRVMFWMSSEYSDGDWIDSPWSINTDADYTIHIYKDIGRAEICYYAWIGGSPGGLYNEVWRETLTYERQGDSFVITGEELVSYHDISSGTEYAAAYPGGIDNTMIDYTRNGLGEALNDYAVSSDSDIYGDLLLPESAAVCLLSLSRDPDDVSISVYDGSAESGEVGLDIFFLQDQDHVMISMIQPYGKDGIWVPADYRINVISRFMDIPWEEIETIPDVGYNDPSRRDKVICIGEIPEYDIRVYGYNDEEISGRGVAIDIAGDVNYFDWYYTSSLGILPRLYWDEDARQLQMALHIYTGTGFSAEKLVILQQYDTGTLEPYYFDYDDYTELLSERIDYRFDQYSRELTLIDTATGREAASVIIPEAETDFLPDGEITGIACGDISYFELGETIKLFVRPGFFREGYAIAEYTNMPLLEFEVDREWVTDAFGNTELSFDLGELTGVYVNEE